MMTIETKPANVEQEMRNAFKVFDKDNSGTISADEIAQVMKTFGQTLSDEELQFMIQEVDKNGDGTIDCMFKCHVNLKGFMEIRANVILDEEFVHFCMEK
jgi:calmodulin